jgi:Rrf2 family protein
MFSQTVEYALRAVVHLAYQAPEAHTTAQIADATRVPKDYLSKILQGLAREGIVKTQRGVGGGVSLVKDPAELSILDVVNAVEPESVRRITTCPLGLKTHGVRLCPLHKRLDDAVALVETAFRNTTLAEVLAEPSESVPLCETQEAQKLKLRKAPVR